MFFDVVSVGLNSKPATDETMKLVRKLTKLQHLDLAAAQKVTNEGLKQLEGLDHMTYLRLDGTSVTDDAIREYQRTHANVEVVR